MEKDDIRYRECVLTLLAQTDPNTNQRFSTQASEELRDKAYALLEALAEFTNANATESEMCAALLAEVSPGDRFVLSEIVSWFDEEEKQTEPRTISFDADDLLSQGPGPA